MKKRALDQKNYMIGVNTWLFAVGAILAGYNTYINLPSTVGEGGLVIGILHRWMESIGGFGFWVILAAI